MDGSIDIYKEKKAEDANKLENLKKQLDSALGQAEGLKKISDLYAEISEERNSLKAYNDKLAKAERAIIGYAAQLDKSREEYIRINEYKDNVDKKYTELVYNWENIFSKYYVQDDTPADENTESDTTEYDEENIRELTGRFAGLKEERRPYR